jgi:hypothetical protein
MLLSFIFIVLLFTFIGYLIFLLISHFFKNYDYYYVHVSFVAFYLSQRVDEIMVEEKATRSKDQKQNIDNNGKDWQQEK